MRRGLMIGRRGGLTLIEILLVIAIMALLASLLLPSLKSSTERGREGVCFTRAHSLGQSLRLYADDWESCLPPGAYSSVVGVPPRSWDTTWHDLLLPYLNGEKRVLMCPSVDPALGYRYSFGASPWMLPFRTMVPEWRVGPGEKLWMAEHATGDWASFPRDYWDDDEHSYLTARHNGRAVVGFLDGHAGSALPDGLSGNPELWRP